MIERSDRIWFALKKRDSSTFIAVSHVVSVSRQPAASNADSMPGRWPAPKKIAMVFGGFSEPRASARRCR